MCCLTLAVLYVTQRGMTLELSMICAYLRVGLIKKCQDLRELRRNPLKKSIAIIRLFVNVCTGLAIAFYRTLGKEERESLNIFGSLFISQRNRPINEFSSESL